VQIDDQRAVRARCREQIGHQLRGNRNPGFVLPVLSSVTKIGNHRGNPPSRSPFQRVDHQQQLHQVLIDGMTGRLNHEHVGPAHVLLHLDVGLAVPEATHERLASSQPKESANLVAERLIGGAAKNLELFVHPHALRLAFGFLIGAHRSLLVRRCRKSGHSLALRNSLSTVAWQSPIEPKPRNREKRIFWLGR
jgi:hypothetical protein